MSGYANMSCGEIHMACGDDAMKWAEAFQEIVLNAGIPVTEELMLGWFANAIETAHDKRTGGGPVVLPDGSAFFVGSVGRRRG